MAALEIVHSQPSVTLLSMLRHSGSVVRASFKDPGSVQLYYNGFKSGLQHKVVGKFLTTLSGEILGLGNVANNLY